jgi:hypothetical protein
MNAVHTQPTLFLNLHFNVILPYVPVCKCLYIDVSELSVHIQLSKNVSHEIYGLTAVALKRTVFWDETPYSLVDRYNVLKTSQACLPWTCGKFQS